MSYLVLDRRIITGEWNDDIPKCVLVDLAEGNRWSNPNSYPYHVLLQNINESEENLNKIDGWDIQSIQRATKENLVLYATKIAAFVNPDKQIRWSLGNLIIAFKHMLSIVTGKPTIPSDFESGPKTMSKPHSYNACMLYKICRSYGVKMRPTTTLDELTTHVRIIINLYNKKLYIPKSIKNSFTNISNMYSSYTNLVTDMQKMPPYIKEYDSKNVSFDILRSTYDKLSKSQHLMRRIDIESHEESIIIAALNFSIDITQSQYPLAELENLIQYENDTKEIYLPVDESFRKLYMRNPDWYSLKKNYSSALSMVYDDATLKKFLIAEAFTAEQMIQFLDPNLLSTKSKLTSRDLLKNALLEARLNNTFYNGWHPNSLNDRSPIELEDFEPSNIDTTYCVTYGSLESENNLTTYLISELVDHFTSTKSFSNPIKITENFSSVSINKLKLICLDNMGCKLVEKKTPVITQVFDNQITSSNPATRLLQQMTNSTQLNSFFSTSLSNTLNMLSEGNTKKKIIKKIANVDEEKEIIYRKLYEIIEIIEEKMINLNEKAKTLKYEYDNMNDTDKKLIVNTLNKLLDFGLCMRGYRVVTGIPSKPQLPIKSEDTIIPPSQQDAVSDQVNGSIIEFENSLNKLSKTHSNLIKQLTLLVYQISSDDKISFKESTDIDEGFSIWDRILIVKDGEKTNNTCSCIRLSSNWICSSAYYYMLAIELPIPFNIRNLSKIS